MKILNTLPSIAARSAAIQPVTDVKLFGGNLVRALQARYGFMEVPTRVTDFDFAKGVRFLQGMFKGHLVDMQIMENGVRCYSANGTTVLCDAFLDDLFLAAKEEGVHFEEQPELRVYGSTLEVEMNCDFNSLFSKIAGIGRLIGAKVASYGGPDDVFQGIGFTFVGQLEGPAPDPFKLERRVGLALDSNVFFSSAPLSIGDHLEVLEELERLIG